jgi:hypothetical protein
VPTVSGHSRAGRARFGSEQFTPGEDPSLPPIASARVLTDRWQARDALYERRKVHGVRSPLTEDEQNAVIAWRRAEAETLVGLDRSVALSILSRWAPPRVMA